MTKAIPFERQAKTLRRREYMKQYHEKKVFDANLAKIREQAVPDIPLTKKQLRLKRKRELEEERSWNPSFFDRAFNREFRLPKFIQ